MSHDTSPRTGLQLDSKHLVPNFALRSAIDDLRARRDRSCRTDDAEGVEES